MFRTRDHSLVAELVAMKALTEEQARTSPQSNVVARGLGSTSNHVPETERVPYRKDDRFILCTDGLWGAMPHETLLRRLTARGDIGGLAESLSRETDRVGFAAGGHHDNHTLATRRDASHLDAWRGQGASQRCLEPVAHIPIHTFLVARPSADTAAARAHGCGCLSLRLAPWGSSGGDMERGPRRHLDDGIPCLGVLRGSALHARQPARSAARSD